MDKLVKQVKRKRIGQGYSIRSLAEYIGVSFSTVARLERGVGSPDRETTERLVAYLKFDTGGDKPDRVRPLKWSSKIEDRLLRIEEHLGIDVQ